MYIYCNIHIKKIIIQFLIIYLISKMVLRKFRFNRNGKKFNLFQMFRQNYKKIGLGCAGVILCSSYSYKKHMYEKEMFDQYNYLLSHKVPMSGIYVQQRQPFPILQYIQWLMPYHQSLKFVNSDGSIRQVGLGRSPNKKSFFDLTSEFVSHTTKKYSGLEMYEKSVPLEVWVDYKFIFGHFPENVNVETLKKLTMTREEAVESKMNPDKDIYTTTFGSLIFGIYGKWVTSTCNYALLHAVRTEELMRKEELSKQNEN